MKGAQILLGVGLIAVFGVGTSVGQDGSTGATYNPTYNDENQQCRYFRSYVNEKGDTCGCRFQSTTSKCSSDSVKKPITYSERNKKCRYNHGLESYVNDKANPCECGSRGYAQCTSTLGTVIATKPESTTLPLATVNSAPAAQSSVAAAQDKIQAVKPTKGRFSSRFQKPGGQLKPLPKQLQLVQSTTVSIPSTDTTDNSEISTLQSATTIV